MSVTAAPMPSLSTLLRLGRISNLPTVWTNVLAGSVIAGAPARLLHQIGSTPTLGKA